MKKLYTKLEHFEELEMLLEKERLEVERARQQVYADRLRYAEAQTASQKSLFRSPAPNWKQNAFFQLSSNGWFTRYAQFILE